VQARKQVKSAHEIAVIDAFVRWYSAATSKNFRIIDRPDPPDAIIQCGSTKRWIEHADVYRNSEEAREEYSYVTPGEKPFDHSEHPILEPDKRIAMACAEVLRKKLTKTSYREFYEEFVGGILLLTERDPSFSESTLECIKDEVTCHDFSGSRGYFTEAYIGYRRGLKAGLFFEKIFPNY